MIIFSNWFVYYLLNWCEIEKEGLCPGGQGKVRLLFSIQLISITENVYTVTMHFCHRGLSSGDSFQLGEKRKESCMQRVWV